MVQEDIYKNGKRYNRLKENLIELTLPPKERSNTRGFMAKYTCKNRDNLRYFRKMFEVFDANDISYARRNRVLDTLKVVSHVTEKDFKDLNLDDRNSIFAFSYSNLKSYRSKCDFRADFIHLFKTLFPNNKVLVDQIRKPSKSSEVERGDRLEPEQTKQVIRYFNHDKMIQAFLVGSYSGLLRPQELAFLRNKDVEVLDDYVRLHVASHGKTGTGVSWTTEGRSYFVEWKELHPNKDDEDAYFFISRSNRSKNGQVSLTKINHKIKTASRDLFGFNEIKKLDENGNVVKDENGKDIIEKIELKKPITIYSMARNGISDLQLTGSSQLVIKEKRRWTTMKQLSAYTIVQKEEAIKSDLLKHGKIQDQKQSKFKIRTCVFCETENSPTSEFCSRCHRELDRTKLNEMARNNEYLLNSDMASRLKVIEEKLSSLPS